MSLEAVVFQVWDCMLVKFGAMTLRSAMTNNVSNHLGTRITRRMKSKAPPAVLLLATLRSCMRINPLQQPENSRVYHPEHHMHLENAAHVLACGSWRHTHLDKGRRELGEAHTPSWNLFLLRTYHVSQRNVGGWGLRQSALIVVLKIIMFHTKTVAVC